MGIFIAVTVSGFRTQYSMQDILDLIDGISISFILLVYVWFLAIFNSSLLVLICIIFPLVRPYKVYTHTHTYILADEAVGGRHDPAGWDEAASAELIADIQRRHPGVTAGHCRSASYDSSSRNSLWVSPATAGIWNGHRSGKRGWRGSFTRSYKGKGESVLTYIHIQNHSNT